VIWIKFLKKCAIIAEAELEEETGLKIVRKKLIFYGKKENFCWRIGGNRHFWSIYKVFKFSGELNPSPDETKQAGWYGHDQLLMLARRTKDYLAGKTGDEEWEKSPGLEPVWYELLQELDIIWPSTIDNKRPEG